jgi:tripartite-type tricarboxylate transporter receptor subunit TctC
MRAAWMTFATSICGSLALANVVFGAPADVTAFYKNKQISIIVGTVAGGGYDAYARLIAPSLAEHIPGRPQAIVENMPGAGSIAAARYVYAISPKDGTEIGAIFPGAIMAPLLGPTPVGLDPSRFQFLGSANDDVYVCIARKDAAVQKFDDAFKNELIMGASTDASGSDIAWLLKNVLGVKFKIVTGYTGNASVMLAIEKNEIQGACSIAWPSILATHPSRFGANGIMRVLVQTHSKGYPDLNATGVPKAADFADTPEKKTLLNLYFGQTAFGRPYVVAPGVPIERVAALRAAFTETMTDPKFVTRAQKVGLDLNAVDGAEVQRLIAQLYAVPSDMILKLRKAISPPA